MDLEQLARNDSRGDGDRPARPTWNAVLEAVARRLDAPSVTRFGVASIAITVFESAVGIARGVPPFDVFGHPYAVDLSAHLTGGALLARGQASQMYQVAAQIAAQRVILGDSHAGFLDLYASPPFVALIYAPLSFLPYPLAAVIWTLISLVAVLGGTRLLWPWLPDLQKHGWPPLVLGVVSSWPVLELLLDGQDSGIVFFLYALGFVLLARGRDGAAGAVLSLGLIKPQLVFLIPFLLLRQRRWQALRAWIIGAAFLSVVSVAFVGTAGIRDFASLSTGALRVANHDLWWKAESLPSLLEIVLPGPFGPAMVGGGILGGVGLVLFGPFYRQRSTSGIEVIADGATLVLITALCAPHFLVYDATILIYPALIVLRQPQRGPALRGLLVLGWFETFSLAMRHNVFGSLHFPLFPLATPLLPLIIIGVLLVTRSAYAR